LLRRLLLLLLLLSLLLLVCLIGRQDTVCPDAAHHEHLINAIAQDLGTGK
jgi:hypothetical protein